MYKCKMKHCNTEFEETKIHVLTTKELPKIYMKLVNIKSISTIDKLYKEFEKLALDSPQITYSRCIYNNCKKDFLKNFNILITHLENVNNNKNIILKAYVPEILRRSHLLLEKDTHTDSEILQMSFYQILTVFAISNQKPVNK